MSVFSDSGSYWMISGATKSGVPWISHTLLLPSMARENPKSHNLSPSAAKKKRRENGSQSNEHGRVFWLYLPSCSSWAKCFAVLCRDAPRSGDASSLRPLAPRGCSCASSVRSVNRHRLVSPVDHRKPLNENQNLTSSFFFHNVSNLHLQNEHKLVTRLINSMKLHDLLGIAAEHQHCNLMLNLLDPASGSTPTPQELCCIFNASLFVRCSTNRSEISSARSKNRQKWVNCELKQCKQSASHVSLIPTTAQNNDENVPKKEKQWSRERFIVMLTLMHGKLSENGSKPTKQNY